MTKLRDVTVEDLNKASCRALRFMGRHGLEVEIRDGRITGIAKSPTIGDRGESKNVNKSTPLL